jgi:hypothetical protein
VSHKHPDPDLRVVYRRPDRAPQRVARLDYFQNQQEDPITREEFLILGWKLANDEDAGAALPVPVDGC